MSVGYLVRTLSWSPEFYIVCMCARTLTHVVPPFSHHTHTPHTFLPSFPLFLSHYVNILQSLDILISVC